MQHGTDPYPEPSPTLQVPADGCPYEITYRGYIGVEFRFQRRLNFELVGKDKARVGRFAPLASHYQLGWIEIDARSCRVFAAIVESRFRFRHLPVEIHCLQRGSIGKNKFGRSDADPRIVQPALYALYSQAGRKIIRDKADLPRSCRWPV